MRKLLVASLFLFTTGCGALQPLVCDCEREKVVCADGSTALAAREQPFLEGSEEFDDVSEETEEASEEEVDTNAPRTLVDPYVDAEVTPASPGWPQLKDAVGLSSQLPASAAVLRGNFDRRGSVEAALLTPATEIEILGEGGRRLEEKLVEDFAVEGIASTWARPAGAAELVSDDVLEILVFGVDRSGEIEVVLFSVYKVFGDRIGRVFTAEVGRVAAAGISKTAEIEFLGGRRHVAIRRTPLDSSGQPDPQRAEIYEWNRWEGMFRIPAPPPTAKPTS